MKFIVLMLTVVLLVDLCNLAFERCRRALGDVRDIRKSERRSELCWVVIKCGLIVLSVLVVVSSVLHIGLEAYKAAVVLLS